MQTSDYSRAKWKMPLFPYLRLLVAACRYEDLKQQLMAAQNLAEQEGDQEQLARAAAAVARLTFPAGAVDTSRSAATV